MFTKDEAQKLGQKVLGYSTFPECQVTVTSVEEAYTRFANNGITTASLSMRRNVSVTVTRDGQTGQYAVDDLDDGSLKNAVQKAEELAIRRQPSADRARRRCAQVREILPKLIGCRIFGVAVEPLQELAEIGQVACIGGAGIA